MNAYPSIAETSLHPSAGARVFWLAGLVVAFAFLVAEHDPQLLHAAAWNEEVYSVDALVDMINEGSILRKVSLVSLGLLGVYGLLRGSRESINWRDPLVVACLGFVGWCAASIAWSEDPGLTARRVVAYSCVWVAGIGLARLLTLRQFVGLAFAVSFAWVALAWAVDLSQGRFSLTEPNYRFAGLVHPNIQSTYCAMLCLATIALWRDHFEYRKLVALAGVMAATGALMTRSRTALAALAIAIFVLWLATPGRRKQPWLFVILMFVPFAAFMLAVAQFDVAQTFGAAVNMGRADDTEALTGRLPLWTELLGSFVDRPLIGAGYGAFWTPERTQELADIMGWTIWHAHSDYVDGTLQIGAVGVLALAFVLLVALARAAVSYRRTGDPCRGFLLSLLTFAIVEIMTESFLLRPWYFSFLTICAVFQLAERAPSHARGTATYLSRVVAPAYVFGNSHDRLHRE